MSYPHRIRLRGPWHIQPLWRAVTGPDGQPHRDSNALPPGGRAVMPASWGASLGVEFRGCVRHARRFTRPSDLESHERVWLVFEGVDTRAEVMLNEEPLGQLTGYALRGEFEITGRLRDRNELVMDVELPLESETDGALVRPGREHCAGGLVGEVRLEIRSLRYVNEFSVQLDVVDGTPGVQISGQIAGHRDAGDLALVINGLRRELAYQTVAPDESFSLRLALPELPVWQPAPKHGNNELVPLEVALLENAAEHWHAVRGLAQREVRWLPERNTLEINDRALEWPAARLNMEDFPASPSAWRNTVDAAGAEVLIADMIFPTACYTALDRWGVSVIQCVPTVWQSQVVSRLSQHPSIVAWTFPEAEQERTPDGPRLAGRPWLARSLVVR